MDMKDEKMSDLSSIMASLAMSDEQYIMRDCLRLLQGQVEKMTNELSIPLETNVEATRDKITQLMKRLHHHISKFVVFISQSETAKDRLPVVTSLTEEFLHQLTAFVCTLRSILPNAGTTLKSQVVAAGKTVLQAISSVIDQVQSLIASSRPVEPHIVGIAWDSCKSIETMPLTNDTAINKALMSQLQLVKDARSEIGKLKEGKMDDKDDDEGDDDEDFDDEDFDNMSDDDDTNLLSHEEFALVAPCADLCGLTYVMLRHLCGFALRCKDRSLEHVLWLESQLQHAHLITTHMDEMGESLYHPQNKEAITRATSIITTTLSTMVRACANNKAFIESFKAEEKTSTTVTTTSSTSCPVCPCGSLPISEPSTDASVFLTLFTSKLHAAHQSLGVTGPVNVSSATSTR